MNNTCFRVVHAVGGDGSDDFTVRVKTREEAIGTAFLFSNAMNYVNVSHLGSQLAELMTHNEVHEEPLESGLIFSTTFEGLVGSGVFVYQESECGN